MISSIGFVLLIYNWNNSGKLELLLIFNIKSSYADDILSAFLPVDALLSIILNIWALVLDLLLKLWVLFWIMAYSVEIWESFNSPSATDPIR